MFGVFDVRVAISAPADKMLVPGDLDTLAEIIRWDDAWNFEVAEPGDYGRGCNPVTRSTQS